MAKKRSYFILVYFFLTEYYMHLYVFPSPSSNPQPQRKKEKKKKVKNLPMHLWLRQQQTIFGCA